MKGCVLSVIIGDNSFFVLVSKRSEWKGNACAYYIFSEHMAQRCFQRFNAEEENSNLVHQKLPYTSRLRHLENHTEAVDLYLMN